MTPDLLHLIRDTFTPLTTTGRLLWEGKEGFFTLEDTDRGLDSGMSADAVHKIKVSGLTAIPVGRYRLTWSWSPHQQRFTPRIQDVPGYQGILLHVGNYAKDTDGCLLAGTQRAHDIVTHSQPAIDWLWPRIEAACKTEQWITIERDAQAWAKFHP